jgi:IS5 family transposase
MGTGGRRFYKLGGMAHQPSFSQAEFAAKKKTTRREKFLARMEEVIPWARLLAVIEPHYPTGQRGRPPIGLERMSRVYFLQQWNALADEALEDALTTARLCAALPALIWRKKACPTPPRS